MLGWDKDSVKNYAALRKIDKRAWDIIGTTFEKTVLNDKNDAVLPEGTTVLFTERLLRSILPLLQWYQLSTGQCNSLVLAGISAKPRLVSCLNPLYRRFYSTLRTIRSCTGINSAQGNVTKSWQSVYRWQSGGFGNISKTAT
jgi:hypothetical protein